MCLNPTEILNPEEGKRNKDRYIKVPCGKCIECQLSKSTGWINRMYLESLNNSNNCFITLTFGDEILLKKQKEENKKSKEKRRYKYWMMRENLYYSKEYFKLFMKRLRQQILTKENCIIKYYHVGEYGSIGTHRAHHHVVIFGWKPKDYKETGISKSGKIMGKSEYIEKLWGLGITSVQEIHNNIIKYAAQYTTEKIIKSYPKGKMPPYQTFSNRYGIGKTQLIINAESITNLGGFYIDGKKQNLTKTQIEQLKENWEIKKNLQNLIRIDEIKEERIIKAMQNEKKKIEQYGSLKNYQEQKKQALIEKAKTKARYRNY